MMVVGILAVSTWAIELGDLALHSLNKSGSLFAELKLFSAGKTHDLASVDSIFPTAETLPPVHVYKLPTTVVPIPCVIEPVPE